MSYDRSRKSRARASNFTGDETTILLGLATVHRDVILDKKTDSASNKLKSHTWQKIADDFNTLSRAGEPRDAWCLRAKFDGVKADTKKLFNKRKELGEAEFAKRWNSHFDTMFKLAFLNAADPIQEDIPYSEDERGDDEEITVVEYLETDIPHFESSQNGTSPSVHSNVDNMEVSAEVTINQDTTHDIYESKTPNGFETVQKNNPHELVEQLKRKTIKDIDVRLKHEKLTFFKLRNEHLRATIRQKEEKFNRKRERHELKMMLMRQKLQDDE